MGPLSLMSPALPSLQSVSNETRMPNAQHLPRPARPRESSSSSGGGNDSQSQNKAFKKPKKKVSRFYRRQSDLVKNFKKDNAIIEESQQRRRQRLKSSMSVMDPESGKLLASSDDAFNQGKQADIVHDVAPKVTVFNRETSATKSSDETGTATAARWLAMATLLINISLVVAKGTAAYLSGSLSIISSLVDSAVDITSGLVIWLTARAIKKRDPYLYPRGRTRLEPIALIIVSVIMGVASVQMIVQSLESILRNTVNPHTDVASISIMLITVLVKLILVVICQRYKKDASIAVLAQDHRNDCISNTVALVCAWVGSQYWVYLDPIGAIVVSLYIAITWYFTGKEHLTMLSGRSAEPDFINRIIKVCVEHDKRIDFIDTVYVYHFGMRFLVEVHIVLDKHMSLQVAHDISEGLQIDIEALEEVERAFVHCDYEYDHMPADEHKIV
ncbi:hypothetical protein AB6A40_001747 [Gnathostoma spinigerum]|uniref:Cation efflux protein cytoplasmic domain-containing protein n=1 Tax=Gnathostoma spinigerum TaxID=75299 RepID=A0ABD6E4V7_9BILA